MEININPEDIDKFVKEKIMESALGKEIQRSVASFLNRGYSDPVSDVVKVFIRETVTDVLKSEYDAPIREGIKKYIEKELNEDLLITATSRVIRQIEKIVEDY